MDSVNAIGRFFSRTRRRASTAKQDRGLDDATRSVLGDFIKQRRRIQNGHLWLKQKQDYKVVSQDGGTLLWILLAELREYPASAPKVFAVMLLEMYCRLLGSWDFYIKGKNPFAWDIARSTKDLGR